MTRNVVVRTVNDLNDAAHQLQHVAGRCVVHNAITGMRRGQQLWAAGARAAQLQVAWEWTEIEQGLLALLDPMGIVSNVVLVDAQGQALPHSLRAVHLNNLVYQLDWRRAVRHATAARCIASAVAAH